MSRKDVDLMDDILVDPSTPDLVAAINANLVEQFRYLASSPRGELHDSPHLRWWLTGLPHPWLNGVQSAQLPPDSALEIVQKAVAHFRSRAVTGISWWSEPGAETGELGKHLLPHGFTFYEGPPGMAADLWALNADLRAPPDLRIEPVQDVDTLKQWVHTFIAGFGFLPRSSADTLLDLYIGLGFDLPMRSYLGLLKGKPVATSQLFLLAGVAGINGVATLPEARRQGIGTALTLAALRDAQSMGYRIGSLQAAPMGLGIYRRLGFQECCRMNHYMLQLSD
jgi:ribosomal protein S18 acetylase RimI-like enzyme